MTTTALDAARRPSLTGLRRVAKYLGVTLILAVGLAVIGVVVESERRLRGVHPGSPRPVTLPAVPDTARGRRLAHTISHCAQCHGQDLGGKVLEDLPIFRAAPPNLTRGRGGIGDRLTLDRFANAVRGGIHENGTSLILMPSAAFSGMSDADVHALFSYVQALTPVDRDNGATYLKLPGRTLLALGKFKLSAEVVSSSSSPLTENPHDPVELGRYLTGIAGCAYCHGEGFRGRSSPIGPPDSPLPTNISPSGIGHWTEEDFVRALRTGRRPDGRAIDTFMPWKQFRNFSDEELHSLWVYLRTLPSQSPGTWSGG